MKQTLGNKNKSEHGQVLVIIALAMIGLIAMTGLAIDGSMVLADRRHAQNAADTAALAGALAKVKPQMDADGNIVPWNIVAMDRAISNGYTGDLLSSQVEVYSCDDPDADCAAPYTGDSNYVQVVITSHLETTFARVVGIPQLTNRVQALALAEGSTVNSLFEGAAVVGLNPRKERKGSDYCGFDTGSSNADEWHLVGGGVFSNGCAYAKNTSTVNLDEDADGNPTQCVTTVGPASNFKCMQANQGSSTSFSLTDMEELMPTAPACDNTPEGGYIVPSNPSDFTFENGVYCVSNFDAFDKQEIVLNNATLYVTDQIFDLKFAGKKGEGEGGFSGTASTSGPYQGVFLVIGMNSTSPCVKYQDKDSQSLVFRGNGSSDIVGTIMAPTSCLDFRGNSNGHQTRSQVIGYTITSNGNSGVFLDFTADENYQLSSAPLITLVK